MQYLTLDCTLYWQDKIAREDIGSTDKIGICILKNDINVNFTDDSCTVVM